MQMSRFGNLLVFVTVASFGVVLHGQQTPVPEYRILLVIPTPDEGVPESLDYSVSVPNFLGRNAIEGLICKFIAQEKPATRGIGITFYQGLEKITRGDLLLGTTSYEHQIAIYAWPSSKRGFLTIVRDSVGARIRPMQYEFDHEKACSQ
jgi:hypothetical protein